MNASLLSSKEPVGIFQPPRSRQLTAAGFLVALSLLLLSKEHCQLYDLMTSLCVQQVVMICAHMHRTAQLKQPSRLQNLDTVLTMTRHSVPR